MTYKMVDELISPAAEFCSFTLLNIDIFKQKLVLWANEFSTFVFLDTNHYNDIYGKYDFIIGIDAISYTYELEHIPHHQYLFGWVKYNYGSIQRNDACCFFIPRIILYYRQEKIYINRNAIEGLAIIDAIQSYKLPNSSIFPKIDFEARTKQDEYMNTVHKIQNDIRNGRYYELKYCMEFKALTEAFSPIDAFNYINPKANSPMSALVKHDDQWTLSFSPERFAAKRKNQLIAQPMKGTARRDLSNSIQDEKIKLELKNSIKERAENTMIVDLLRNDLTHYAQSGSIQVKELCKIYTFPFVHQMISTIEATIENKDNSLKALDRLIPAGSMTGAPKSEVIRAISEYENFDRQLYAGNIGYIDAEGDFDFNVVIRTLFYDAQSTQLKINVGGAITLLSDAEKEYEECLLKAEGILRFFR